MQLARLESSSSISLVESKGVSYLNFFRAFLISFSSIIIESLSIDWFHSNTSFGIIQTFTVESVAIEVKKFGLDIQSSETTSVCGLLFGRKHAILIRSLMFHNLIDESLLLESSRLPKLGSLQGGQNFKSTNRYFFEYLIFQVFSIIFFFLNRFSLLRALFFLEINTFYFFIVFVLLFFYSIYLPFYVFLWFTPFV